MLRFFILMSLTVLVGVTVSCDGDAGSVTPGERVVARAGPAELTVEELARIIGGAGPTVVPLSTDAARTMASLWIDYSLLAQTAAALDSLNDSTTLRIAGWRSVQQGMVTLYGELLDSLRPELRESLPAEEALTRRGFLDSIFLDSLERAGNIKVVRDAPAYVREAVPILEDRWRDGRVLASYTTGELTVGDFAHWLSASVSRTNFAQLTNGSDSTIRKFVYEYAKQKILVDAAYDAGIDISQQDWEFIQRDQQTRVGNLRFDIGVLPRQLLDSSTTLEGRQAVAHRQVVRFLTKMAEEDGRFVNLPFLVNELRERHGAELVPPNLPLVVARAGQIRAARAAMADPSMATEQE